MSKPQRVIITGGATNIGRAISEAFLEQGASVAIGQRRPELAAPLVERYGQRVFARHLDLANTAECRAFIAESAERLGGVDVLVNNAAVTGPGVTRRIEEIDEAYVDQIMNVNFRGLVFCCQSVVPHMKRAGGGVIIHITSINAIRPQRGAMIYAASKAAVGSLAQSMGKELAADNIRVVAVAPGDIGTGRSDQLMQELKDRGMTSDVAGQTPLGVGAPEDVGAVVTFLCSKGASFVTGTTWLVDGGLLS